MNETAKMNAQLAVAYSANAMRKTESVRQRFEALGHGTKVGLEIDSAVLLTVRDLVSARVLELKALRTLSGEGEINASAEIHGSWIREQTRLEEAYETMTAALPRRKERA